MKPLLIIKTGQKLPSLANIPGDYEHWISAGMKLPESAVQILDTAANPVYPDPEHIAGVVITGSGAMVTEARPWMTAGATWLAAAVQQERPILGICFGHQWLAHALGGQVDYNPRGVEVGTVTLHLTPAAHQDPLFTGLPSEFAAQVSHRQSVISLPPGAAWLAHSAQEPHHAFRYGQTAWGIQFHPEFDRDVIPHFIQYYAELLQEQGSSARATAAAVTPTPDSASLLPRFAQLVARQQREG